jgi:hypothetical protein
MQLLHTTFTDYPYFIGDDFDPSGYSELEILRQPLADALRGSFPAGSPEYQEIVDSLDKTYTLNGFQFRLVFMDYCKKIEAGKYALNYVKTIDNGIGIPCYGRFEDY